MKEFNYHVRIEDFMQLNKNCNVYCYDLNHKFISTNHSGTELYNSMKDYNADNNIIGKTPTEVYPSKGMDIVMEENNQVISSGKVLQFLNRVNLYHNKSMVYLTIKAPLYDEENNIAGVFGISQLLSIYDIEQRIPVKLTKREQDCIVLLMKGKTSKEIAAVLKLSIRTIESYLNNLKYKFNCHNKSELLRYAYDLGLSTFSDSTTSEVFNLGVFMHNKE